MVVFHFLRQAIGTQSSPPNQVIIGLSLFMTFFIIKPVALEVYDTALNPYLERQISYDTAFDEAQKPIRKFLLRNTREADIALFVKEAGMKKPETRDDVSLLALIPAYVISELKTAFIVGFILYVPFLVIDMVVGLGAAGHGHDDAAPGYDFPAFQTDALCPCGRLAFDCRIND